MKSESDVDVVIITALQEEKDAVLLHFPDAKEIKTKHRTYYKTNISHAKGSYSVVILSLSGMGNVHSSIATTQAIDVWNPQFIILTGIAGGVKEGNDDRLLGDVVIGEQIIGYEMGKITDDGIERRPEVLRPAHILLEAARDLSLNDWVFSSNKPRPDGIKNRIIPKVHFGVVASGSKVIKNANYLTELKSIWSKLIGVEMEGFGIASAAYESDTLPGMLMIKAISDFADAEKDDNWHEYAAEIAAIFTISLLKSAPFQSREKTQAIPIIKKNYSGKVKIKLCQKLRAHWYELADYFEIQSYIKDRFPKGRECHCIWEWLEDRDKLNGLEDALHFIEREDLAELILQPF